MTSENKPPLYPVATRDRRCPLDPAPAHREFAPLQRGRIWDDTQPWLVSTNALFKKLIADPRVSNDIRNDAYPSATPAFKELRVRGGLSTFDRRDGDEHAIIRRIVMSHFSPKQMNAIRPAVQAHLDSIFDKVMAGNSQIDIVADLAYPFSSVVLFELIGIPYSDYDRLSVLAYKLVNAASTPDQAISAFGELKAYLADMLDNIGPDQQNGVLAQMANEQLRQGIMTRDQVLDTVSLLISGGYETTANTISLATYALLSAPEQWADLRDHADDVSIVRMAVEELLRFTTVTHFGRRRVALEDIEIEDVTIKAGEAIVFVDDVCNRDPAAFRGDPDTLDIRRDARGHVAFAFGPHNCAGNLLARMELAVFFSTLAKRMPNLKFATDPETLVFQETSQIYGIQALPVTW